MMKSNKIVGNAFEREFAIILFRNGWWVHNTTQGVSGQPADIIAAKGNITMLIDCKVCANDTFPLSRIEPNQRTAMRLWSERVNQHVYFALKMSSGDVYIASASKLMSYEKKALSSAEIRGFCTLKEWLGELNESENK